MAVVLVRAQVRVAVPFQSAQFRQHWLALALCRYCELKRLASVMMMPTTKTAIRPIISCCLRTEVCV